MKTPYRYLIGIAAGIIAGMLLPVTAGVSGALEQIADIVLRLGRYMIIPLAFFALPVAVTQLRRAGRLGGILAGSILSVLAAGAILAVTGTALAWITDFGRIPVIPGNTVENGIVGFGDMIRGILVVNGFRSLVGDGSFLLPILVPAFIIGWHFHHDREISEPAYNLFDSLSRVVYRANRYLMVLMPAFLTVLTARAVLEGRDIVDFRRFLPLIGILCVVTVFLIGAVYPFLLWLGCGRRSPWKTMAGLMGAFLGALVSGSPLFNYGNLVLHLKENLNLPRKTTAVTAPFFLMFSRGGTALIAAFSMLTIIRSYSSLEITLFQAAWTALFAFLVSFALPATPDRGVAASLVMMGALYGRGLDDGWLILAPLLPILTMIAALLDGATGAVMMIIINRRAGFEEEDERPALRI